MPAGRLAQDACDRHGSREQANAAAVFALERLAVGTARIERVAFICFQATQSNVLSSHVFLRKTGSHFCAARLSYGHRDFSPFPAAQCLFDRLKPAGNGLPGCLGT